MRCARTPDCSHHVSQLLGDLEKLGGRAIDEVAEHGANALTWTQDQVDEAFEEIVELFNGDNEQEPQDQPEEKPRRPGGGDLPPPPPPLRDGDEDCNEEQQAALAAEVSSPDVLEANMVAAGASFPPFPFATHHIVAGNEPRAAASRAHLHDLCIGINEAINGVFLRYTDVGTGAYHPGLHTTDYYNEVERRLMPTTTRAQATLVLQGIAEALQRNEFPY